MKYLIATILSALALTANAQHRHHKHHGYHYHGGHATYNWVAPMVIGGVVTYALTRPQQPPQVVYQQPQAMPPAPVGYRYEQILDANCNCYRWVLVQG